MNQDDQIFKEAMQGVKPTKTDKRYTYKAKLRPKPINLIKDNYKALLESMSYSDSSGQDGDGVTYSKSKLKHQILKKLKNGKIRVESDIDLHGLTAIKARAYLRDTIRLCLKEGLLCVRVIHGKGIRSGSKGPVLKDITHQCLAEMEEVAAFVTAKNRDGGSGAVYVLLANRTTT